MQVDRDVTLGGLSLHQAEMFNEDQSGHSATIVALSSTIIDIPYGRKASRNAHLECNGHGFPLFRCTTVSGCRVG